MDDRGTTPAGATGATEAAGGPGAGPEGAGGWTSMAGGQWPGQLADAIEGVVTTFRTQVIRPLMLVARGLVFGIIVGTMTLVVSVLLAVSLVRLLTVYLFDGRVWASYLLLGVLFVVAGTVAWIQRHSPGEDSAEAA